MQMNRGRLGIRKNLFTMSVVKYWKKLLKKVADVWWFSALKKHLVNTFSNIFNLNF